MNKMKQRFPRLLYVAIDVDIPSTRGSFTHTYEIAKNLHKKHIKVYVVARRRSFDQPSQEFFHKIPIFRIFRRVPSRSSHQHLKKSGIRRYDSTQESSSTILRFGLYLYKIYLRTFLVVFCALFLIKLIKKYKIDLVLERGSSHGAGVLASRITKRPSIVEIIDNNHSSISLKLAEKVIIYTKKVLKCFVPEKRLVKVTAAANTELFDPDINPTIIRKKYGLWGKKVIGYAGNFEKWHGVFDLVCAANNVLQADPTIVFLLVGNATPEVTQMIHTTGKCDSFILAGPVDYIQVPMYLAAADILVAPFNPAGADHTQKYGYIYSPIKIFEYMAMGKPVIASNLLPIKAVIRNGIDGVLVPPGKPQKLANAILSLLQHEELKEILSRNARTKVLQFYSWNKLTSIFLEIIKSTLTRSEANKY
ncbi:MAG: glycosyltransferase family 4 protein [Candidatus Hodarchaeota archaeon]